MSPTFASGKIYRSYTPYYARGFKITFRSLNSPSFIRKTMKFGSFADGMMAFNLVIILFPISRKIILKTAFGTSSK